MQIEIIEWASIPQYACLELKAVSVTSFEKYQYWDQDEAELLA